MKSDETRDLIALQEAPEERAYDFMPKSFDEYLGQKELLDKLKIYTQAAHMRGEPLDHLLLFGPPGLGKTTLAQIMSHVMNVSLKICSGPMLERSGDLVAILSSLECRDILFIDEIHRMAKAVEEVLYSAMEHFRVDVIIGQGAGAKSVSLPIQPFTLIAATTKSGMLSAPLRSRFGISERLDFYDDASLAQIILQNAQFLHCTMTQEAAHILARCSRGTPRTAKKIIRRIRDIAQVQGWALIDHEQVTKALSFLKIDHEGLTDIDRRILHVLIEKFNGGPTGLETLASLIGEDADTIETVYEPFLMRKGLIERTTRGRQIPTKLLPHLVQRFAGQTSWFD